MANLKFKIKDEEGNLVDDAYLMGTLEYSSNQEDFVKKVNYGITNHKSSVSEENNEAIREWYNQNCK